MSAAQIEAWLARLFTDGTLRQAFLDDPDGTTRDAGLDEDTRRCLMAIDRDGLVLAARSHEVKRAERARAHVRSGRVGGVAARVRAWLETVTR